MRTNTLEDYKRRMLRVLLHIQQHLDDSLALEDLARVACFSPFHFHRIFTGMVGETLQEHIRRLRLERAASQLKVSAKPVTEIAFEAGYESHEAFTRSFRGLFGCPPSAFRSAKRKPPLPASPSRVHYAPGKPAGGFKSAKPRNKTMDVTIKPMPALRVAFMRHVGPYSGVGATWDRLLPILGKDGRLGGDCMMIGICHDDPDVTPPEKIRYDACVTVDETFVPEDDVGVQVIAGGEYAMTTHFGPYHKLGETYAQLFGHWLPRSGRELRSVPSFEVYLNDPQTTDPEDLLTDIYLPLQ
jgi:AraC family transcriptional regulator